MESDIANLARTSEDQPGKDQSIAQLERKVQDLERAKEFIYFYWMISVIVLLDAFIFIHLPTLTGPLIIGIFEILAVVVAARQMGVDEVFILVSSMIASWGKRAEVPVSESSNKPQ